MTEIRLTAKTCNCDPGKPGSWRRAGTITDDNNVFRLCPHIDIFVFNQKIVRKNNV